MIRVGLVVGLLLMAGPARALEVLLPPIDAPDFLVGPRAGLPPRVQRAMTETLRESVGVNVLDARAIGRDLGIDLGDKARRCNRDLLCLVQLGDAASADRILLTELTSDPSGAVVLRALVVDVAKASLVDTVRWTIPGEGREVEDAAQTLMRQLFLRPDAQVLFDVYPKDAQLEIFGEQSKISLGAVVPYWTGRYLARVSRAGHEPRSLRFDVPPGGPTRITIELEQDPLYVDPERQRSRVRSDPLVDTRAVAPLSSRPSPFANWVAWSIVGVGAAVAVVGLVEMNGAQSDYNRISNQVRFDVGLTTEAELAVDTRASARSTYTVGSGLALGGAGLVVGGLLWMLIDGIRSPAPTRAQVGAGGDVWSLAF